MKDGKLPAYYARPAKGTGFPIILVNEEVFGVHEYIQDVCRRFAKLGYMAVAPEIYFRNPDFPKMTDDAQIMREVIFKTPDAQIMSDLDATLAWAAHNHGDASRMGEIGFCFGGRNTWLYAAHNPNLKAAVAFYGHIKNPTSDIKPKTVLDIADQIQCPLLGLYGGQDPAIRRTSSIRRKPRRRPRTRPWRSSSTPMRRTASTPTIARAIARPTPRTRWKRALAWFKRYGVAPKGAA